MIPVVFDIHNCCSCFSLRFLLRPKTLCSPAHPLKMALRPSCFPSPQEAPHGASLPLHPEILQAPTLSHRGSPYKNAVPLHSVNCVTVLASVWAVHFKPKKKKKKKLCSNRNIGKRW